MSDPTVAAIGPGYRTTGWLIKLEQLLLLLGFAFLLVYLASWAHGAILSRFGLWQFNAALAATDGQPLKSAVGPQGVNVSLWSEKRIRAFRESLASNFNPPLAVLNIPKFHLTVPIFEGTDDLTLNRGLGRIEGTARVGQVGNLGIAGHRDGFFRILKDIAPGDSIEVSTPIEKDLYVVDRIDVVEPSDVSVLRPRPVAAITLVTCYPFYFVGDAPRRYIVQASLKERQPAGPSRSGTRTSEASEEK